MIVFNAKTAGVSELGGTKRKSGLFPAFHAASSLYLSKRRRSWRSPNASVVTDSKPESLVPNARQGLDTRYQPLRRSSSIDEVIQQGDLQSTLNVTSERELKDFLNCLLLSECSYKIADMSQRAATRKVQRVKQTFPKGLVTIDSVQWSLPTVNHRYMLAEDKDTIYVSFMGTKQRRDLAANAAVLQEPIWPDINDRLVVPAAHRGFLARAKGIPIEALYANACCMGKRLVLTGHSLGGSVAQLSCLKLLRQLPKGAESAIRSITFACPAIGNAALKEYVIEQGWTSCLQNYLIPEDLVPRLLASPETSAEQVAESTIDALQPEEAKSIEEASIEPTIQMFNDIYDVVLSDDPYQVPLNYGGPSSVKAKKGSSKGVEMESAESKSKSSKMALDILLTRLKGRSSSMEDSVLDKEDRPPPPWNWHLKPDPVQPPYSLASRKDGNLDAGEAVPSRQATGINTAQALSKKKQEPQDESWAPGQSKEDKMSAVGTGSDSMFSMDGAVGKSDKEKAIEAANLFKEMENPSELEDPLEISDSDEEDEPDDESALLGDLAEEYTASKASQNAEEAQTEEQLDLPQGYKRRRGGRQTLKPYQDIFFPWSSKPLPSFARQAAAKAAAKVKQSAGRLKGRRLPFQAKQSKQQTDQPSSAAYRVAKENEWAQGLNSQSTDQPTKESRSSLPSDCKVAREQSSSSSTTQALTDELPLQTSVADSGPTQVAEESSVVGKAGLGNKGSQLGSQLREPFTKLKNIPISRFSAGVGKAASGAAKNAAKFVSVPLRAAQSRYAVIGQQAFLTPASVVAATGVDSEQSFQIGLQGAKDSSIASALAAPLAQNLSAYTIVSLQLPIAAARRRNAWLMHKMAFHRVRVLSLLEGTLIRMGVEPYKDILGENTEVQLSETLAPKMEPTRAEVFLPYSLPDDSDLKVMLEDLSSLSSLPPMTIAVQQSQRDKRFQWLSPWRWISGLGWSKAKRRGTIELTAQVRGKGLENCTRVQVKDRETGVVFQTELLYKPAGILPEETYNTLGLHRPAVLRSSAKWRLRAQVALSRVASIIDRTNAMRAPSCLLVKIYLPLEGMTSLESRLLKQSNDDSGLTVTLMSDFRKVQIPLSVHGGGSWVISDLRSSSRFLDEWLSHNVSG